VADDYTGPVRIYGGDGIFLTTGVAALEGDESLASWKGLVQTLRGTAVAGKALVVELEIPDGGRARAQLTPQGEVGERYTSIVNGLGAAPF
jgi:hypothetical protein